MHTPHSSLFYAELNPTCGNRPVLGRFTLTHQRQVTLELIYPYRCRFSYPDRWIKPTGNTALHLSPVVLRVVRSLRHLHQHSDECRRVWAQFLELGHKKGLQPHLHRELFAAWWKHRTTIDLTPAEAGLLLELLEQWPPQAPAPFLAPLLPQFQGGANRTRLN